MSQWELLLWALHDYFYDWLSAANFNSGPIHWQIFFFFLRNTSGIIGLWQKHWFLRHYLKLFLATTIAITPSALLPLSVQTPLHSILLDTGLNSFYYVTATFSAIWIFTAGPVPVTIPSTKKLLTLPLQRGISLFTFFTLTSELSPHLNHT